MAPTQKKSTTSTPRRQSCDRCHGQKLKCTRVGNRETGVCNRCLRQGAQCVYSSSLPKGRPSIYNISEEPDKASDNLVMPLTPVTTPVLVPQHPAATADADSHAVSNTNINNDPILDGSIEADSSAWSWLEWNDMQVDVSPHESIQSASDLNTFFNPHDDASATFFSAFPSTVDEIPTGISDDHSSVEVDPITPINLLQFGPGFGSDDFKDRGRSGSSGDTMKIDQSGPDVGIAELSQLSMRLYPLHRSSCTLAETAETLQSWDCNQISQKPLIDEAAFSSMVTWLVPSLSPFRTDHLNSVFPTGAVETLNSAFSASHHLLEILRRLQFDTATTTSPNSITSVSTPTAASMSTTSTSATTSVGGIRPDFWTGIDPQSIQSTSKLKENTSSFEQNKTSTSYARGSSSQYSNTVIRHLIIACHTLLLNIYVAVLITLQHDVDLLHSSLSADKSNSTACGDTTALADVRLVMTVHLCSHLIERQQQAVDLYLNPQTSAPPLPQQDLSSSFQSSSPMSMSPSRLMSDLEVEIEQRLTRLRQMLRI